MAVLDYIVSLDSSVATAIIMTAAGLLLGAGLKKALKGGLTIGIAFTGLNLVIGMLMDNLGPAVKAMIDKIGVKLTIIDIGWPATATLSYSSKVGALIIPLCLGINLIMLFTKTTRTLNVDIWNYWHVAFAGALAVEVTGSLGWGLVVAGINVVILIVIADLTAKTLQKENDIPGVSFVNGFSGAYVPLAAGIDKILDRIPYIKDIKVDSDLIEEKFGFFGDPMFIGTVMGLLIGHIAGYEVKNILKLGIKLGAVLTLIPKIAGMLAEGIRPISEAAQQFMADKFDNRNNIFIGIDPTAIIGHPTSMSVGLILVPITIIMAVVLPGNKVLPFADLAILPYMLCMVVAVTDGDVVRTLIIGIIAMAFSLWIATDLAPIFTELAQQANIDIPKEASLVSSIDDGGNPVFWLVLQFIKYKLIGTGVLILFTGGLAVYNRKRIIAAESE